MTNKKTETGKFGTVFAEIKVRTIINYKNSNNMKTAKELLENYRNELSDFKYTQSDTLLTLLGMWAKSENKKEIKINPGEFRCSVQRFVEVEQTNIVRLSIDAETLCLWLYDEDDNRIGLDDVIDDGAISSVIMLIANHLE